MKTTYERRASGLIAPAEPKAKPPEHPARELIRNALEAISDGLLEFEKTTHGCLGPFSMASVAARLEECYREPTAYTISDLSQHIEGLLKQDASGE